VLDVHIHIGNFRVGGETFFIRIRHELVLANRCEKGKGKNRGGRRWRRGYPQRLTDTMILVDPLGVAFMVSRL
jgi:hypothetical protein